MKRGLNSKKNLQELKKFQVSYGRMIKSLDGLDKEKKERLIKEIKIIESKSSVEIEATGKDKLCFSNL